jgi:hypothetical protein
MKTTPSVLLATLAALLWIASSPAMAGGLIPSQSLDNQSTALNKQKWVAVRSVGQTITVTTCNDVSDFSGAQQVSDLPGPDGRVSFREACTAANNTAGSQTIAFAIPVADFWSSTTVALLKLEQNAFFLTDSGTTIDFSTQTTNIGDTNPGGPEVEIYGLQPNGAGIPAIFVKGNDCVIKGLGKAYLRGFAVELEGNNNRVIGCQNSSVIIEGYMSGPNPTGNIVGGTAPGEGNTFNGNTVTNGITVIGAPQYGVFARNNRIGGPTSAERNVISGAGHYGLEGYPVGEQVSIVDADGTIVEGNYIGTTADGMSGYPQIGPTGVEVRDSRGTTIRGNLIAGFRTVGINHYAGQIFGQAILVGATNFDSQDTLIQGNTIGLAADGVTPIVTRSGIVVSPMSGNYHAFGTLISSNHIASVETTGVIVGSQENGITITGNSIHDCGALGIDLFSGNFGGIGGVTPNDPGDGDIGGNGLQNFPLLVSAATTGSAVMIQGMLDSSPSAQFMIEFFASPSCDPSGFGEGAAFIGSTPVITDGMGHATFSLTLPAAVAAGKKATATATRLSTGDTSEFSACVAVTSAVQVLSVVSRKTHGNAGFFDIDLPLTGNAGIECRSGGTNSDYKVVFTFPTAVTLSGASVTPASGKFGRMVGQPNLSPDGKTITVDLTNVTDARTIVVTLSGVSNGTSTNNVPAQMRLLVGDTSGNGVVNASDVSQTKLQSGQAVTSSNFRTDVIVNGTINASDLSIVKARSGTASP